MNDINGITVFHWKVGQGVWQYGEISSLQLVIKTHVHSCMEAAVALTHFIQETANGFLFASKKYLWTA